MVDKEKPKKTKAEKMYGNSPTIQSDEAGKKVVKRTGTPTASEKKSARVNDGTDGIKIHEKHAAERTQLMTDQYKAFLDMHARHAAEAASGPATGDGLIDKVEKDKKE